jgi:hypothetical protein
VREEATGLGLRAAWIPRERAVATRVRGAVAGGATEASGEGEGEGRRRRGVRDQRGRWPEQEREGEGGAVEGEGVRVRGCGRGLLKNCIAGGFLQT